MSAAILAPACVAMLRAGIEAAKAAMASQEDVKEEVEGQVKKETDDDDKDGKGDGRVVCVKWTAKECPIGNCAYGKKGKTKFLCSNRVHPQSMRAHVSQRLHSIALLIAIFM